MPTSALHRRRFLDHLSRRAAALALSGLFGAASARNTPPARAAAWAAGHYPFTLGVASGMPRSDSVAIWTRLAPQPHAPHGGLPEAAVEVGWELAEDERFSRGLRSGTVVARFENAHSVHVQVDRLRSGARCFYRFTAGDAVSPVGRTRTAAAQGAKVQRLRLALASCQHYEQGSFAAHREIAERDLDLVLFVGDCIYESSHPRLRVRRHEGPAPFTLDAYRARHATYQLDADLQAAHAAHPWLLTWDDHEVENDYAGAVSSSGMTPAAFLTRRAAAYKAYFEHMPVAPTMAPQAAAMRIHDRCAWGDLAELWTLDNRQFRDPAACDPAALPDPPAAACAALADTARSRFGMAQEAWLADSLAASPCRWKLLGQGSQISTGRVGTVVGPRINLDGWDGYPAARRRLLQAIAQRRGGDVLCLGGDVHRNVAAQLRLDPSDPRSPVVASEFVCTSISSRAAVAPNLAPMRDANPDIVHARGDERGYALIEIDRERASCEFRSTASPATAGALLGTQARFTIEAGGQRLERA